MLRLLRGTEAREGHESLGREAAGQRAEEQASDTLGGAEDAEEVEAKRLEALRSKDSAEKYELGEELRCEIPETAQGEVHREEADSAHDHYARGVNGNLGVLFPVFGIASIA